MTKKKERNVDDAVTYIANQLEVSNTVLLIITASLQFGAEPFCSAHLDSHSQRHIMFLLVFFYLLFSLEPLDTQQTKTSLFAGPAEKKNRGK